MNSTRSTQTTRRPPLNWLLILGLGALPLAVGLGRHLDLPALALVGLVTLAWVLIAGLARIGRPVMTLALAGLTAGAYAIVLSALITPMTSGRLQGPVAEPFAIIPVLVVPTIWGLGAGFIALALQRLLTPPSDHHARRLP
ncbi:hypothetical protein GCM10022261_14660 [Brevibacterium daeguense]|uniref:Histidinol dehydrogenase n=1 Tax=Brevibacterium daeguense TaxID=909936 RepID=A0ABP8EJ71_9MICO|nr:hypothetical protein [Brevibacterium daeguense]